MNTIKAAAAAVTGARHLRTGRNGQDAAVALVRGDIAVAVVCDGCSSGASSEVGARLAAEVFAGSVSEGVRRLHLHLSKPSPFEEARRHLVRTLADLLERMPGDREQLIHDLFLFTIVAAVITPHGAAVWALGDGAYAFGGAEAHDGTTRDATTDTITTHELGPFPDNAPPYLAYDLLGDPREATFATASRATVIIATDGAADLGTGLERFREPRLVNHPDALRRELALLARTHERIDWETRRVVRAPAILQDDCAIAILHHTRPS